MSHFVVVGWNAMISQLFIFILGDWNYSGDNCALSRQNSIATDILHDTDSKSVVTKTH
jgi:hypothetical protein